MSETADTSVLPISIEDEMRSSFLEYSMSVIVSRALPDVRDGLKPVHRRILFGMSENGNTYNKAYKKSARTVGDVMGKYHPHGDSAIYDAMVRMAQPFSLRYPLIDGQGNFGSVDDPPAAMRYTEARLDRISGEVLEDLYKETVDFSPNYDESQFEPKVLPSKLPNLLLNGSGGIAVGMTTNIPPHNLGEVIDGIVHLIDNPECGVDDLMEHIPGPDFPTAGEIHGSMGIRSAYHTGRGLIVMRAKAHIEIVGKTEREQIAVTEIPYQVSKARLIEKIADLVRDKRIVGISDIRDESDRDGTRIVIELKRDTVGQVILNQLYKHTQMQDTFGVIMLALVNGQPKQLNLKQVLQCFIEHRREIITRRTLFELRKARERQHLLEGFKKALDNLNDIIELIRASSGPEEARNNLVEKYEFSQAQAKAILELRLQRLTGMERQKILDELAEITKTIAGLEYICDHEEEKLNIIKRESLEIKERFADDRRTLLVPVESEMDMESLIAEEDMVVTISTLGYIKRNSIDEFRAQRRGGKGVKGMSMRDEDIVQKLFIASTHDNLLFFTTKGRVFRKKVYEAPLASRTGKGKAVVNLIQLQPDEKVATIFPLKEFEANKFLVTATKKGYVKKTKLELFSRIHAGGIIATELVEGDAVIAVKITDGNKRVLLSSANGMAICFHESDMRPMGRVARGVRGIRLDKGDSLTAMTTGSEGEEFSVFSIKADGLGKRSDIQRYPVQRRDGRGVIDIKCDKNSPVKAVLKVSDDDDIMIITKEGVVIRIKASDVSMIGRNTKGVRVINLSEGDSVVSVGKFEGGQSGDQDNGGGENNKEDGSAEDSEESS